MPSVLGCSPSGSRYGNVPNELIHRAGPPFLDNHYRGYQYDWEGLATALKQERKKITSRMQEMKDIEVPPPTK